LRALTAEPFATTVAAMADDPTQQGARSATKPSEHPTAQVGVVAASKAADSPYSSAWAVWGWISVVAAAVLIEALLANNLTSGPAGSFKPANGIATLAGFSLLAAGLERLAEFALAPWWGKVKTAAATEPLDQRSALVTGTPKWVGVSGAAAMQARALATAPRSARKARAGQQSADSVYVAATKQRPTIMLPMAAGAAVICAFLHLYLLHSLAKSGIPTTRLAYVGDALLTGFILAGGAQPFHDLVTSLTSSSAAKQATST
jgi:hypothetical protein